jgi:hypothetical protein
MSCLDKDPDRRPDDARVLGDELATIARECNWNHDEALAWWESTLPGLGLVVPFEKTGAARANFVTSTG